MKAKKCKVCREEFIPTKPLQAVCGFSCALTKARQDRQKTEQRAGRVARAELRVAKEKAKTRSQWMKEAQAVFNGFIRERDYDLPCISCDRRHDGQYHAGHYLPTSTKPSLRFNEFNNNKQCSACNNHLHGNLILYRIALIKKIGMAKVRWLEGPHEQVKYTIPELQEIKAKYTAMARELKRGREESWR